ncbi:hypothetical protein D6833_06785, partial [Candidatus Parcubacteria bacterium]
MKKSNFRNRASALLLTVLVALILISPIILHAAGGGGNNAGNNANNKHGLIYNSTVGVAKAVASVVWKGLKFITATVEDLVGYFVLALGTMLAGLWGFLLNIEFWFLEVILAANNNILHNNPVIENGFRATLSLANLGFVAILVIIAIATILRVNEEYGIKKAFAKLVIAALLVNFSLVIVGPILGTANSLSTYIVEHGFGSGRFGIGESVSFSMMQALGPQRFLNPQDDPSVANGGITKKSVAALSSFFNSESQASEGIMAMFATLAFINIALALMVAVIGVFMMMLFVRYIALSILLILMPLIWVLWIFPSTRKYWNVWWQKFINWTIFAPIVLFFLWLAASATSTGFFSKDSVAALEGSSTFNGIVGFIQGIFAPLVVSFLQSGVVLGLIVGGIIVARHLSIIGAGMVMGFAKKQGKVLAGKAVEKARSGIGRAVTAPLRTEQGQQFTEKLQNEEVAEGWIRRLHSVPVVGGLTRRAGRRLETLARQQGEKRVDTERARLEKSMSVDQMIKSVHAAKSLPEQIGMLELINKAGRLDEVKRVDKLLSKENAGKFQRFHRAKAFEELRGKSGV